MLHELGYQAGHGDKQQTVESNQPGSWCLLGHLMGYLTLN